MEREYKDLTGGNILKQLISLSLPIMATSFMQMAYNLTDLIWIGRLGSGAVASIGTAGFFVWFGNALLFSTKIGAEVKVSQALGSGDTASASGFGGASLRSAFFISLAFGALLFVSAGSLMGFFDLGTLNGFDVSGQGTAYLRIMGLGSVFIFSNPTFTGIYNGAGDSRTPFKINAIGLATNLVLDPLLIFGLGPLKGTGVYGAAVATVFSHALVTSLFIFKSGKNDLFALRHMLKNADRNKSVQIMRIGLPVSAQNMLFSVFAMILAKILAVWGPIPIAVQRVGSQIEAISWMTAGGFSTALGSFVGQNFGAGHTDRISRGYATSIAIMAVVGSAASLLLIFAGEPIFRIFINEPAVVAEGVTYLRILGYSQLFMALEITTAGAFNGMGRTLIPATVSIIFTGLRIPAALLLGATSMGVNAVWWSVSGSSIIKGTLLVTLFIIFMKAAAVRRPLESGGSV